jgi:hypothetical protein
MTAGGAKVIARQERDIHKIIEFLKGLVSSISCGLAKRKMGT